MGSQRSFMGTGAGPNFAANYTLLLGLLSLFAPHRSSLYWQLVETNFPLMES